MFRAFSSSQFPQLSFLPFAFPFNSSPFREISENPFRVTLGGESLFTKQMVEELETVESKMAVEPISPNIMSVELAIKRELAYRRKVEALMMLQSQVKCTTSKPAISAAPPQGPSPISTGTKRKTPTINLKSFRPPAPTKRSQLIYPGSLSCTACQMDFSSISNLNLHSGSKNHRSKLLELKQQGRPPSNPFLCSLCQAPSSGVYQLEVHLTGTRHTACLKEISKTD